MGLLTLSARSKWANQLDVRFAQGEWPNTTLDFIPHWNPLKPQLVHPNLSHNNFEPQGKVGRTPLDTKTNHFPVRESMANLPPQKLYRALELTNGQFQRYPFQNFH